MPTINDIAKEAGVSHGTVSNVLNKTGKVSIEKIQLVENAIKKLGYVPNVQAQRLRQGSPNTIAVILPSLKEAKYIDFFTALQLNFPKSQKSLLVYQTEDPCGGRGHSGQSAGIRAGSPHRHFYFK